MIHGFVGEDGSTIDVVDFGSYDPSSLLADALVSNSVSEVDILRCERHLQGDTVVRERVQYSSGADGIVMGQVTGEYGGLLVIADPAVRAEDVLAVATGLRLTDD